MKSKSVFLGVAFASLIAAAVLYLFQGNISAFSWHIRHGFHREVNGMRFVVPLFYEESDRPVANQFSISSIPSPIHKGYSSITVEFLPSSWKIPASLFTKDDAPTLGLTYLGARGAKIGSRSGNCIEYLQNQPVLSPNGHHSERMGITCRFGEQLVVQFDGLRRTAPEFYSFMEDASEVNH